MSRRKLKAVALIGFGAIAALAAAKAVSHARNPDGWHGGGMGGWRAERFGQFENDPTGAGGPRGLRQHWSGITKEDFDARTRERFARLDRNSDGVIDRTELEAGFAALAERMGRGRGAEGAGPGGGPRAGGPRTDGPMHRLDTNRDGKLTRDEMLAGVRKRFAEADLDGDGKITDADLPPLMRGRNAIAEAREGAGSGMGPGRGRRMGGGGGMGPLGGFAGADTNKDNVITLEEAIAHATRRFDLFDRNKDGVIDQADRDGLRKEMTDYRIQRFMHQFGAKDGKITREQFFARAAQRFAEMDANNDGRITRDDAPGRRGGWRQRFEGGERGDGPRGGPPAPTEQKK
jgi:Ca2+-binding EF-hand superfamily protein